MPVIKIRDGGKEHQLGNPWCPACHHEPVPHHSIGGPVGCGGLVHFEQFAGEVEQKCDVCLETKSSKSQKKI